MKAIRPALLSILIALLAAALAAQETGTVAGTVRDADGAPLIGASLSSPAPFNDTEVTRVAANPPELEGLSLVRFGRTERGRIEEGQPEDKFSLVINVDHGRLAVLLRTIRFGEVTNRNNSDPTRDQTFSAEWVTDLDVSYRLTDRLSFAVGGNNIFDVFPDENIARNSFNGIFVYNGVSPFGFNGAYYYSRLSFRVR